MKKQEKGLMLMQESRINGLQVIQLIIFSYESLPGLQQSLKYFKI